MHALKKASLFLCLLACVTAPGRAEAAWGMGPLGGANFAFANVDGHDSRSITGWAFGARLEMGLLPFLAMMVDPMLLETGVEFDVDGNAVPGRGKFVNLEIPVLLNARLDLGALGVYGFLGPDLVFNMDAHGNIAAEDDLTHADTNPFGLSGQVGAGVAVGIVPAIEVTADARYSHGFTDLIDGAKGDIRHWRSRDVRLTLGILAHTPRFQGLW